MCTNRQADAGRVGVIVPNEGLDLAHWAPCAGHLAHCGHTGHWWCPGNPKWGLGVDAREGRMTQPVAEAAGEQIGDASLGPIRGGDRLVPGDYREQ